MQREVVRQRVERDRRIELVVVERRHQRFALGQARLWVREQLRNRDGGFARPQRDDGIDGLRQPLVTGRSEGEQGVDAGLAEPFEPAKVRVLQEHVLRSVLSPGVHQYVRGAFRSEFPNGLGRGHPHRGARIGDRPDQYRVDLWILQLGVLPERFDDESPHVCRVVVDL